MDFGRGLLSYHHLEGVEIFPKQEKIIGGPGSLIRMPFGIHRLSGLRYSFYKSAAQGRFMRYRTNAIPMDQPGRYLYIRDHDSGDFWSASWQPAGKLLDQYKSVCRHGTAYTVIDSLYSDIRSETTYFVPPGKEYEYWHCRISNKGSAKRKLRLFTFIEYTSNWHLWMDIINLQYTQYILTMDVVDGIIDQGTNVYLPPQPDNFEEGGQARHTFLGVAGVKVTGFDTDRKRFLELTGAMQSLWLLRTVNALILWHQEITAAERCNLTLSLSRALKKNLLLLWALAKPVLKAGKLLNRQKI